MANKLDAIHSLMKDDPEIFISWDADANTSRTIKYLSGQTPLTDEQIDAEVIRLDAQEITDQATFDSEEWKRNRLAEYPSVQELVVALYDVEDRTVIDEKRAAVKLKYPKPIG